MSGRDDAAPAARGKTKSKILNGAASATACAATKSTSAKISNGVVTGTRPPRLSGGDSPDFEEVPSEDDTITSDEWTQEDAARTWKWRFKSMFGSIAEGACAVVGIAGEAIEPVIERAYSFAQQSLGDARHALARSPHGT